MEQKKNNQMVFGIRAVTEAIEAGKEIENLFLQHGLGGNLYRELQSLLNKHRIKYQLVPSQKLNRICSGNHQGVVAFISPVVYQKIEDIIPAVYEKGEVPLVLILDRITDVRNFGAIVRTAECSGVHAVVIPLKGGAQVNEDAIKTSAGAIYNVPLCREHNLKHTIAFLKESGLQIVACTEKYDHSLYDVELDAPTAIIMGSEEDGISGEYLRLSDTSAKIPLMGGIGSLNVSVAAAIVLYEAVRQRLSIG